MALHGIDDPLQTCSADTDAQHVFAVADGIESNDTNREKVLSADPCFTPTAAAAFSHSSSWNTSFLHSLGDLRLLMSHYLKWLKAHVQGDRSCKEAVNGNVHVEAIIDESGCLPAVNGVPASVFPNVDFDAMSALLGTLSLAVSEVESILTDQSITTSNGRIATLTPLSCACDSEAMAYGDQGNVSNTSQTDVTRLPFQKCSCSCTPQLLRRIAELQQSHDAKVSEAADLALEVGLMKQRVVDLELELDQVQEECQAEVARCGREMTAQLQVDWDCAQRKAAEQKKAEVEHITMRLERHYQIAYIEELRKTQKKFNDDLQQLNRRYTEGTLHQLAIGQTLSPADGDASCLATSGLQVDVAAADRLIKALTIRQQELEDANRALSKDLEATHKLNEVMSEELVVLRSENDAVSAQLSKSYAWCRSGVTASEEGSNHVLPRASYSSDGVPTMGRPSGDVHDSISCDISSAGDASRVTADWAEDPPGCHVYGSGTMGGTDFVGGGAGAGDAYGMGAFVADDSEPKVTVLRKILDLPRPSRPSSEPVGDKVSSEEVHGIRSLLDSAHKELFDRMQQHWQKVHTEEMAQLDTDRQYEIHLQLESLKAVMQQTYNGQLEFLKNSYESETELRVAEVAQRLKECHQRELEQLETLWRQRLARAEAVAIEAAASSARSTSAGLPRELASSGGLTCSGRSSLEVDTPMAGCLQRSFESSGPPSLAGMLAAGGIGQICSGQQQQRAGSAESCHARSPVSVHWRQRSNGGSGYEEDIEDWVDEAVLADDTISPRGYLAGSPLSAEAAAAAALRERDYFKRAATLTVISDLDSCSEESSPRDMGLADDAKIKVVTNAVGDCCRRALAAAVAEREAHLERTERERDKFWVARLDALTRSHVAEIEALRSRLELAEELQMAAVSAPEIDTADIMRTFDAVVLVKSATGNDIMAEETAGAANRELQSCHSAADQAAALAESHRETLMHSIEECRTEATGVEDDAAIERLHVVLKAEFEERATAIRSECEARVEELTVTMQRELEAERQRHVAAMTVVQEQAAASVLHARGAVVEELTVKHQAATVEAQMSHRVIVEQLNAEHRLALAEACREAQEKASWQHASQTDLVVRELKQAHAAHMLEVTTRLEKECQDKLVQVEEQLAEALQQRREDVSTLTQLYEQRIMTLQQDHSTALQEISREWQERMDDALHAAALDSEQLVVRESATADGGSSAVSEKHAPGSANAVTVESATCAADNLKSRSHLGETVAVWRANMTELMAEQDDIRRENARRLDELQQTYEQQLVAMQHTVEQLLEEGAEKDATINKLSSMLHAAETDSSSKVDRSPQNGRRLLQAEFQQLQADFQLLQSERDAAQRNSEKLLRLLSAAVQQQRSAEECITRRLGSVADLSHTVSQGVRVGPRDSSSPFDDGNARPATLPYQSRGSTPRGGRPGSREAAYDKSFETIASDEGLDMSQLKVNELSVLILDLDTDGEEVVSEAGQQLQSSVERLVEVVEQTQRQLAEARSARDELLEELLLHANDADRFARSAASDDLLAERDELADRCARESAANQRLALELHAAEGIVNSYAAEQEKQSETLAAALQREEQLSTQCALLRSRLQLLEEQRADADTAQHLAQRQHEALSAGDKDEAAAEADTSGVAQPALLRQNTQLDREKHEMSRQYEKDRRHLLERLRELEQKVEDVSKANDEVLEQSQAEKHDLELQLDVMDRQLRANKLFIEEQTHEREAEREEYQRDTRKYQATLEEKKKLESVVCKLQNQIADLESQLQDAEGGDQAYDRRLRRGSANSDYADSPLATQIDELKKGMRYLEVELDAKASQEHELKERLVSMEAELVALTGLNGDLEAELKQRRQQEALSLSASEAALEELQEQLSVGVQQLAVLRQERDVLALELERQRVTDEELMHENNALRKQVTELLEQQSALKSKLDSMKPMCNNNSIGADGHLTSSSSGRLLHEQLILAEEALEKKAAQLTDVSEKLEQARLQLAAKNEQLQAVSQHSAADQKQAEARHALVSKELQSLLQSAHSENQALLHELTALKQMPAHIPAYAQKIIDEKNEELDYLNAQMEQLRSSVKEIGAGSSVQDEKGDVARKEVSELRTLLQKKDDTLQEREEELFTVTEELLALQHQLEAIQGGNSFAQEEAMVHQQQLEETVLELQSQLETALKSLEDATALREQAIQSVKETESRHEETVRRHTDEMAAVLRAEAEKRHADVAAARQVSEGIVAQLRALLDEKEAVLSVAAAAAAREAESVKIAHGCIQKDLRDLRQSLQTKELLLGQQEELTQNLSKEKARLIILKCALEEELSWHKLELQEKDKLMSLLQQQQQCQRASGEASAEALTAQLQQIQEQLTAAVQALEVERTQSRMQEAAHDQELRASAALLEAERQQWRIQEAAYRKQAESYQQEAETKLAALTRERDIVKRELVASTQEATASRDKLNQDLALEQSESLKSTLELNNEEWSSKLNSVHADYSSRIQSMQSQHQAVLATTVEEVKQNLKKAYRRHLASILRTQLSGSSAPTRFVGDGSSRLVAPSGVGSPGHKSALHSQGASSSGSPSETAVQRLLSQALRQGSEILTLSAAPVNEQMARDEAGASANAAADCRNRLRTPPMDGHSRASGMAASLLNDKVRLEVGVDESHDDRDLARLEEHVQSLASRQTAAVDALFAADRRSLLGEIRELRAHLEMSQAQQQTVIRQLRAELEAVQRRTAVRERQLLQQVQLTEYKSAQERVVALDLRVGLDAEQQRASQLAERLAAETSKCASLSVDIKALDSEVSRLEQTVGRRDQQLGSLRSLIEEERRKHHEQVAELQRREQRLLDELQRHVAQRHVTSVHETTLQEQASTIEIMKKDLAAEKGKCRDTLQEAENERRRAADLRAQLDNSHAERQRLETMYKDLVADLQQGLDDERAKCRSLESSLESEQQQKEELQQRLTAEAVRLREAGSSEAAAWQAQVDKLSSLLSHERSRILDIQAVAEREASRAAVVSASGQADRVRLAKELEEERSVSHQLKKALDASEAQCYESRKQAVHDKQAIKQLSNELDKARLLVSSLQKGMDAEEQKRHLQDDQLRRLERQLQHEKWHHQPVPRSPVIIGEAAPLLDGRQQPLGESTTVPDPLSTFRRQLDGLRQRLHRATMRLQGRMATEFDDVVADLQQVAAELQGVQGTARSSTDKLMVSPSSLSAGSLDDIVRHNAELARFVAKLSEEKAELREALANLEEEVWQYRKRSTAEGESTASAMSHMRTSSNGHSRGKSADEGRTIKVKAVARSAEDAEARAQAAEVECRSVRLDLDRLTAAHDLASPSAHAAEQQLKDRLRTVHSSWLKAESLRKALIFQKRYLLLLLGGFQECEAATLQAISQMGAHSAVDSVKQPKTSRGLSRFRSAVRAIAAIRRMKILVRKWHKTSQTLPRDLSSSNMLHSPVAAAAPRAETTRRQHAYLSGASVDRPINGGAAVADGYGVGCWQRQRLHERPSTSHALSRVNEPDRDGQPSDHDSQGSSNGEASRMAWLDKKAAYRPATLSSHRILSPLAGDDEPFTSSRRADKCEGQGSAAARAVTSAASNGRIGSRQASSPTGTESLNSSQHAAPESAAYSHSKTKDRSPAATHRDQIPRAGHSPTSTSWHESSDEFSVDSHYLARLDSLQKQLAADLKRGSRWLLP